MLVQGLAAIEEFLASSPFANEIVFSPLDDIDSGIELLRGIIYEATENRTQAIASYTKALQLNIYCVEVFVPVIRVA